MLGRWGWAALIAVESRDRPHHGANFLEPLSTITRGWNIGQRLIDEYLARSKTAACNDFREVAERIARQGFRMFLNANASVTGWSQDGKSCRIVLEENPLNDFVELPEQLKGLHYSNILCGVIRGALEMVGGDGPSGVGVKLDAHAYNRNSHPSSLSFALPGEYRGLVSLCQGCVARRRDDRDAAQLPHG